MLWGVGGSKLQLYVLNARVLFERQTRQLRTFVPLETIHVDTGRNHKTLVEQLKKKDSVCFLLDEKDRFPLWVLVNELCDVVV